MEDNNWERVQDELDALRVKYSGKDQLEFQNGNPLRDEKFCLSLQLKSSSGLTFKLLYELPPAYPEAKPDVYIEINSALVSNNKQAQLQQELSNFIGAQSLNEELLFSVANFCESELVFDNMSNKETESSGCEGSSGKAENNLKLFVIDVHTFDGHFSASNATCTITIVGASGAKSVALVLPSPLKRGKTVGIETMLDAKLLPISHVELANPTSDV